MPRGAFQERPPDPNLNQNPQKGLYEAHFEPVGEEVHSKLEAASFVLEQGWTSASEDLEAVATGHLEGTQLVAALQQLSPEQREVLMLHMVAGLTVPEVATALGKTVGAVKALRHRGLASLTRGLGLQR